MPFLVLPGETPPAEKFGEYNSYTPVNFASPNLGSGGEVAGWWYRSGYQINGGARFLFGTSGVSAGSGTYAISLPWTANMGLLTGSGAGSGAAGSIVGGGRIMLGGDGSSARPVTLQLGTEGDRVRMYYPGSAGAVQHNTPFTWAANSVISLYFQYMADPAAL